jgi:glycosyltransferase involved in cell wall biosynthesis
MKVCLISLDFIPFRSSGLAVYAENLTRGLARDGHEVTVIASRPGQYTLREIDGHANLVLRIPSGPTNWIGHAWRASKTLQSMQRHAAFDVVHFLDVHFAYPYHGPYVASLFQSFRQRLTAMGALPYSSSLFNLVFRYGYYSLAKRLLESSSLKRATSLIAASQATKTEFVANYAVEEEKIDVVRPGIDTDFFRRRDARELRKRLSIGDEKVLLYVGFSTPRKGVEYLARALRLLPEHVKLVVIGKWEKGYRLRFLRAAGDRVPSIIEVGYVQDEEMPHYYSLADALVLPSLLEGFGLPLVEAMACATPVVATRVGSIPEVVGDAGLLVPARDHLALADCLNRLLCDDALQRDLGSRGRQRAEAYFTLERMAADTLAVYERFVADRRSA